MRGHGFRCDECGAPAVIEGDPFIQRGPIDYGPAPDGWVFLVVADSTPHVAAERLDLCSWACVERRARAEHES